MSDVSKGQRDRSKLSSPNSANNDSKEQKQFWEECLQANGSRRTRRLFLEEAFQASKAEILGLLEGTLLVEAEHEEADGNKWNQRNTL